MAKKYVYTWIGLVSGIFTILLAFTNPFADKAELVGYVRTMEHVPKDFLKQDELERRLKALQLTVITLKNEGELPANRVHVQLKGGFQYGVLSKNSKYKELDNEKAIYIERLEPDDDVKLIFWGDRYLFGAYRVLDDISISSENSGKAALRTDIEGTKFSWFIEKYTFFVLLGLMAFFMLSLLMLASAIEESNKSNSPSNTSFKDHLDNLSYAWSVGALSESEYQKKAKKIIDSEYD
ncbi:hypothetical protein KW503_02940 [Vibrio fluvialis]|nr:hypothetical protein [Vibrio fluvialis]